MDQKIANFINFAFVICDSNGNLVLINNKIKELWKINIDLNNDSNLNLTQLMEIIRESGHYPEPDNFREYIDNMLNVAVNYTNYSKSHKLILADGTHLEENIVKTNDLFFLAWHDITQQVNLNYELTTQKATLQKIIQHIPIALLIIDSSGLIKDYNFTFSQLFNVSKDVLNTSISIKTIMPQIITSSADADDLLNLILQGKSFTTLVNNVTITGIAFTNGLILVNFIPAIIYNTNLNEVQKSITLLNSTLIKEFSAIIDTPLNNIISLSQMLRNEAIGSLNIRQLEYVKNINIAADEILNNLQYKNQLIVLPNNLLNIEKIDINNIIARVFSWLKPSIDKANITIKLDLNNLTTPINTDYTSFSQMLYLALQYIIAQNSNSDVILEIVQNEKSTNIYIKDTAKAVLFSKQDLEGSYSVQLIFQLANQLNCAVKYFYKNRTFRILHFSLNN